MLDIKIEKTKTPKAKVADESKLHFGDIFTDHMFIMDYTEGKGWQNARIIPYGPLPMDPATMVFHYGQATFEGLKAYRTAEGKVQLFRPEMNARRINSSNDRLGIPEIPVSDFIEAVEAIVKMDQDWIPTAPETSLYIRPFVIAADPFLGVRPASTYHFMIILSPVGPYYPEGLNPVKIFVEDEYVRAVRGGTGFTKCAGNYAASIKSQIKAKKLGYSQVLWLDGVTRKNIEEVGSMNVFFKIDGKIVTPALEGSILPGVTRNSCIAILKDWGYTVEERELSIDELVAAYDAGKLEEAFGTGTAAVVSPMGEVCYEEHKMIINNSQTGEVASKLYAELTGIQWGRVKDVRGWTKVLDI